MEDFDLVFDPLPGDDLSRFVSDNVVNVNFARTGLSVWHPVGFFVKSRRGEVMGGLTGHVWGGWLHVGFLWVSESIRRQGHGARLLDAAETMARERGAVGATLETFSFQAPNFYRSHGYTVCGQIDGYPPGHTKFFLRKDL
ncbi:MAG: GNAT family N-acetyltransferase [Acetobacteraceae bacterium]|nr:GNAT family N-acetyltransferase [Pseudomonadota bacterium]